MLVKVVELVDGGSVINRAYPVYFLNSSLKLISCTLLVLDPSPNPQSGCRKQCLGLGAKTVQTLSVTKLS